MWITLTIIALAGLLLSTIGQGLWQPLVGEIIAQQRTLHRGLASAIPA